jgi:hypothetical protein
LRGLRPPISFQAPRKVRSHPAAHCKSTPASFRARGRRVAAMDDRRRTGTNPNRRATAKRGRSHFPLSGSMGRQPCSCGARRDQGWLRGLVCAVAGGAARRLRFLRLIENDLPHRRDYVPVKEVGGGGGDAAGGDFASFKLTATSGRRDRYFSPQEVKHDVALALLSAEQSRSR